MVDQNATVKVNGRTVWEGPWWKVWNVTRNQIADNVGKPVTIWIELLEVEDAE